VVPVHRADHRHEQAHGIGGAGSEVDTDDDEGVLLDGELAGVDVEGEAAKREAPAGELLPCPANGEDEQLGDNIADGERRLRLSAGFDMGNQTGTDVAQAEKLVHTSKENDENREQEPRSEGWVVSR
jgi:hypothetical protein